MHLYHNDQLIGEKQTTRSEEFKAIFTLNYAPGTLRSVGVDSNGKEIAESAQTLQTSGEATQLRLTPTTTKMKADGQDIVWVEVQLLDKNGIPVPDTSDELQFSVTGPVQILATGTADMKDMEPYVTPQCKAWKGRAICAVRSTKKRGNAKLTVKTKAYSSTIVLKTK